MSGDNQTARPVAGAIVIGADLGHRGGAVVAQILSASWDVARDRVEMLPMSWSAEGTLSDMHITSFGRKVLGMAPARPRASKGWRRHVRKQKARHYAV